jgi:hypothetical protein
MNGERPTASGYAAAAAMQAWLLLSGYLLLSALIGALLLWSELVTSPAGGLHPGTAAETFGCALVGLPLLAGFLIVRRGRRSTLAPVRLPPGLFALAAAFALLVLGIAEAQGAGSYGLGSQPTVYGALVTGIGCGLWALKSLNGSRSPRREPAAGGVARPARRYAAAIGLSALLLLGGYVLLSVLLSGLIGYVDNSRSLSSLAGFEGFAVLVGCLALAGVVLLAAFTIVGRWRRRSGAAPATLPRWLSLLVSAAALAALGIAEYQFLTGGLTGRLDRSGAVHDLILGSQWAAVAMGLGWALHTVVSLVIWAGSQAYGRTP